MNERIKVLATNAGMVMYPTGIDIQENTLWGDRNIGKFAELIIAECIHAVEGTNDRYRRDYFASKIREHFGVE